MVLGTSSGAGKSLMTAALCRVLRRRGETPLPFKGQNMSNNARVVTSANGLGEIGSAQYFQALAARAEPEVRMNPLLLKPEADTRSQVVLMGQVSAELTALPWRGRSALVWPHIAAALDALRAEPDPEPDDLAALDPNPHSRAEHLQRRINDLQQQLDTHPDENQSEAQFQIHETVHQVGEQEVHGAQAEDREGVRGEDDERLARHREDRRNRVDRKNDVSEFDQNQHHQ